MDRYLTLARSDENFQSMLTGRFSATEIAIPTRSLEVATSGEKITFHIRPREVLQLGGHLKSLLRLFRLNLLGLTFAPLLVVGGYSGHFELNATLIWAATALLFFHSGIFALNDYVDHMRGLDRVSDTAGSRVIQSGVLPAYKVLRIAAAALALSVLLAIPVFMQMPNLFILGTLAFAFGVFGYSFARTGWRRLLLGGFSVFFTFGPLLVFSAFELFSLPTQGQNRVDSIQFAVLFGWSASYYSRSRQLASAMVDHLAGIHTFATRVGFDRAKTLLMFDGVLFLMFFTAFWLRLFATPYLWTLLAIVLLTGTRLVRATYKARSPISSVTQSLPAKVLQFHTVVNLALILGFVWLSL